MFRIQLLFLGASFLHSISALGNIQTVAAEITLSASNETKVTIQFKVDSLPSIVGFRIIRFDEVEISDLIFKSESEVLEHSLNPETFPLISGSISRANSMSVITISYIVKSLIDEKRVVPIILLDVPSPKAANGVFKTNITYPEGFELQQSFPSMPWTESELQSSFDMQVIPSVVKAVLIPSGRAGINPTTLIDILVMISLIGFSYLGWRRLRTQST